MPTKQNRLALLNDSLRPRWIIPILWVMTLILAACVPIAPAEQSTATSASDVITPETKAALARVESALDNYYKAKLFSGVALIAQDGAIIWSKGWGMADRQQAIANTPQTRFRIYHMTMQFTAAALLLLEQEGKLTMADPICNYLDDCPAAWQPVTIHHLLSHTSGIPDYFDIAEREMNTYTRQGATLAELVALFHDQPLSFPPGEQRVWSRSGFVLAGLIIERVSGQPYGDFVEQHLFQPLGMTHSGYGAPAAGMALGYSSGSAKDPVAIDISAFYAAGGLYSTAEDLFRWNEALYNGQLLDETRLQKMLTWHATTANNQGSGYGIVVSEEDGRKWAGNAGAFTGYAARIVRYLDERVTLVLIGNQDMEIFALGEPLDKLFFTGK